MSYTKQNFTSGQTLTANALNKIEDGIVANEQQLNNKQPKGNYLTAHQKIKTVNGQSLVGDGNIDIVAEVPSVEVSSLSIFKKRDVKSRKSTFLIPNPINKSELAGKKIVCIGDSVTYGYGVSTGYVKNLGTELGATMVNHGISGTVLCTGGHRTCNISKLTAGNLSGADIVLIMMGINDWDQAREGYYDLGDINTSDTTTIYGAMKMWCDTIVELKNTADFSNTKFYFMTPVITSWNNSINNTRDWSQDKTNIHGYTLRDLCQAIIDVCDVYSIPVIDLNLYSGIYYNNANDENTSLYGGDGIHPNDDGHVLIAESIIRALTRNPEYMDIEDAINYSLNYLLALIAKDQVTEISYPVVVAGKATSTSSSDKNDVVEITGITLSNSSLALTAGDTYTVVASLVPSNTTQTALVWESSNESVAKVSNGVVTAIDAGSAVITCKSAKNPLIKATTSVTVASAVSTELTALIISNETATVFSGSTKTISVTYVPANTEQTGITWESTDPNVASVVPAGDGKSCVVTANSTGQCYIRATSTANPSITAQCFFTTSERVSVDVNELTFSTASDTTWDPTTCVLSSTSNPNEPLLNNGGTKNTAILNQPIGKSQEIEVRFDTVPATTYSSANGNAWSIMTVGLDRANDIANVGKDSSYNFPQPDINIYFDHPGKEQNGQKQICMFTPKSKLAKNYYNVSVHDEVNTGLRVIYKRDSDGIISITVNDINVPVSDVRSKVNTVGLAEAADDLYFVVSGLSSTTNMTVVYYGDLR